MPKSISKRISNNSANEDIFNAAAPYYNEALKMCGYNETLSYCPEATSNTTRRTRKRKCIWFNPPYNKNVKTNIGKIFLNLLDRHFNRGHKFHKIFNRMTVKVSYGCMDNIGKFVRSHNYKITQDPPAAPPKTCNCMNAIACPLNGNCLIQKSVYLAKVNIPSDNSMNREYIGISEPPFCVRERNHRKAFRNRKYINDSKLSQYIWKLHDENVAYEVEWSTLRRTTGYNTVSKSCNLCLTEKLLISQHRDKEKLLNKRSELVSKCRHQNKYLLKNYDPS